MKTTRNFLAVSIFTVIAVVCSFFANGCGNESIIGISSPESASFDLVDSVTVTVTKMYGGYMFNVNNRTSGTIINDFHVQFDKTVRISEWSLLWQFDPATTDLNRGKIGEKAVTGQQPISPGQNKDALWLKVQPDGQLNFNWQATKDGDTVQSGKGKLP